MHNPRPGAAKVAAQLFATEGAIDSAITSATELASLMLQVRKESRLSALFGQDALEETLATCTVLGQARRTIIATHRALLAAQEEIGLGALSFGGFVDKGSPSAPPLAVVAA